MDHFLGHIIRHTQQIQRQLGLAAHGVNIRKSVGGGNLTEEVRIIHHWREKVYRLYQCQIVTYFVDRGIVAFIEAHQQIFIPVNLQTIQQLCQNTGTDLGTAAAAAGQFGEFYILFHIQYPLCNFY